MLEFLQWLGQEWPFFAVLLVFGVILLMAALTATIDYKPSSKTWYDISRSQAAEKK